MKSAFVLIVAVVTMVTALPGDVDYLKAYIKGYVEAKRELMDEKKTYHNEDTNSENDAQRGGFTQKPYRDCSGTKFNKDCIGCRNYLDGCCTDSNCNSGRRCKQGIWTYSCDN